MKLSTYIRGLQSILDNSGDMECFYASDDEGNSYQKVHYAGSVYFVSSWDVGEYRPELHSEESVDEIEDPIKVCVVN